MTTRGCSDDELGETHSDGRVDNHGDDDAVVVFTVVEADEVVAGGGSASARSSSRNSSSSSTSIVIPSLSLILYNRNMHTKKYIYTAYSCAVDSVSGASTSSGCNGCTTTFSVSACCRGTLMGEPIISGVT